jgi:hypothetical protein
VAGTERIVWVDAWQIQCCGEPFAVGSTVTWELSRTVDRDFLGSVFGEAGAARITDCEEHHGDALDADPLVGVVRSIERVSCSYAPEDDDSNVLSPVGGSAVLSAVQHADGWEPETDDVRFVGYVVTLDPAPPGRSAERRPQAARIVRDLWTRFRGTASP